MTLVPASSHSPIVSAVRDLTTDEIADLSNGAVLVPGIPGRAFIPVGGAFEYFYSGGGFAGNVDLLVLSANGGVFLAGDPDIGAGGSSVQWFCPRQIPADYVRGDDLILQNDNTLFVTGSILTKAVADGGSLYAPGDTGTILSPVGNNATYTVDTVSAGVVQTFTITDPGTGFAAGEPYPTQITTGSGNNDFTVLVNTVTVLTASTARFTVYYGVV